MLVSPLLSSSLVVACALGLLLGHLRTRGRARSLRALGWGAGLPAGLAIVGAALSFAAPLPERVALALISAAVAVAMFFAAFALALLLASAVSRQRRGDRPRP